MDALRRRLPGWMGASAESAAADRSNPPSAIKLMRRQDWMPDSVSIDCYECSAKFYTLRRKHHCRICGQIFCSKCCSIYIEGHLIGCKGRLLHIFYSFERARPRSQNCTNCN